MVVWTFKDYKAVGDDLAADAVLGIQGQSAPLTVVRLFPG